MGHVLLDFCCVKANFLFCVPKNLGGPRSLQEVVPARLKRGPRAETGGIFVPRVLALRTNHGGEGSGVENKLLGRQNLVLFAGKKAWRQEVVGKFVSKIKMLIDLWSEETLFSSRQKAAKIQRNRERYIYIRGRFR